MRRLIIVLSIALVSGAIAFVYSQIPQQASNVEDPAKAQAEPANVATQSLPRKSAFGVVGQVMFYVTQVEPGSPAEKAGLKLGDLITSINGVQISGIQDFKAIKTLEPGTLVDIEYMRPNPNSDTFTRFEARVPMAALPDDLK